MNFWKKIILICILSLTAQTIAEANILWRNNEYNHEHHNDRTKQDICNEILDPEIEKGYSGVLPICKVNGKHYALLSQENWKRENEPYCDCGGGVKPGETRLDGALREFYEESSRTYDFRDKTDYFLENSRIYHRNSLMTAFLDVPYVRQSALLDALNTERNKSHNGCYHEKKNFVWVDIESLDKAVSQLPLKTGKQGRHRYIAHPSVTVDVLNDDGTISSQNLNLRNFFAQTIFNSREILEKYIYSTDQQRPQTQDDVDSPPAIKEIKSLKEISTKNFKKNTLVLLDFDETVILDKHHTSKRNRHLIPANQSYRLIEPDVAQTIKKLKTSVNGNERNVAILGLTKRSSYSHRYGFDKGNIHMKKEDIPLSRYRFRHLNGKRLCNNPKTGYYNGTIHTAGQNKAKYLDDFLKKSKFVPSHIVIADDKEKNLIDVMNYAQQKGISIEPYKMVGVEKMQ